MKDTYPNHDDAIEETLLTLSQNIKDPETARDIQQNLNIIIQRSGLDKFYLPDNKYLHEVAVKAAQLKDDSNNLLNTPDQINSLASLALYQLVLYCGTRSSRRRC